MIQVVVGVFILLFCSKAMGQEGGSDDDYVKDAISDALYFINACGSTDLLVCLKVRTYPTSQSSRSVDPLSFSLANKNTLGRVIPEYDLQNKLQCALKFYSTSIRDSNNVPLLPANSATTP